MSKQHIFGAALFLGAIWFFYPLFQAVLYFYPSSQPQREVAAIQSASVVESLTVQAGIALPIARERGIGSQDAGQYIADFGAQPVQDEKSAQIGAAMAALGTGEFEMARDSFLSVLTADPNDLTALRGLEAVSRRNTEIDSLGEAGDPKAIRGSVTRVFEQDATSAYHEGNWDKAIRAAQIVATLSVVDGAESGLTAQKMIQDALVAKAKHLSE